MITLRRVLLPVALAALIAGCAAPAAEAPTAAPPPAPSATAAPTAPAPTRAAEAPTSAPPTSAPTQAPPTSAPTQAPTAAPTSAPTQAPPTSAPTQAPTSAPALAMPTVVPGTIGAEILFLRGGDLIAYDPAADGERLVVPGVSDFAASLDGRLLALVRGEGRAAEIWLAGRDGAGLRQLTSNQRAERGLSFAPDGMSLAYSSHDGAGARPLDWAAWSAWCAASEARLLDLGAPGERSLGPGCDPAFAPDGRRLAFASPPAPGQGMPGVDNAIRVVNRQGANGWSFASADGAPEAGMVVYAPAWSPDASGLAYQRFLGYQALVDINLTELGDSFKGEGAPIGAGAGWLLAPSFAPDGRTVAVTEHNFSDARGFSGYDIWQTHLLRLGESEMIAMPSGELEAQAAELSRVPRAVSAAWSPDGAALALLLPAGWEEGADPYAPLFEQEGAGALWRFTPAGDPEALLTLDVDFASPLAWLPPPPDTAEAAGVRLTFPRGWGLREPTDPGDLFAQGDGGSVVAAGGFNLPADAEPAAFFADLVPAGATLGDPQTLPDGSLVRSFRGRDGSGAELAGALRTLALGEGYSAAWIYRATAARWPLERGRALALLGAGAAAPSAQ